MNGQKLKKGVACPAHCDAHCINRTCNIHYNGMCRWVNYGEAEWTRRTTEHVAEHIVSVMAAERAAYADRKKRATMLHAAWPSSMAVGNSELRPPKVSSTTYCKHFELY